MAAAKNRISGTRRNRYSYVSPQEPRLKSYEDSDYGTDRTGYEKMSEESVVHGSELLSYYWT